MGEAHQAVSYSELIKQGHTDANHDKEVLQLVWQSGLRSWKKRIARSKNKIRNGIYPAHIESLWVVIGVVMALHFYTQQVPYDLVNVLIKFMPEPSIGWQTVTCCIVGMVWWFAICMMMRYTLKMLLVYKGFMFEGRGKKVSLKTKVWGVLVKFFVKWNTPSLYSFQGSLPHLPLPSVKDTIQRYLRSMRPLLDDKEYEKVVQDSKEFENGLAKKLQRYLVLKSWWSSNYVSDWWEEYVYLRGRAPLMINSNIYGVDLIKIPSNNQTARAACVIDLMMQFRRRIERQEMKPIITQGIVPLCSWQYERMFNTSRIPGIETDKLVHFEDIKHIVVLYKGCYYKVLIYDKGRLLKACEIKYQFDLIIQRAEKSSHGEEHLAALTSWDRTKWAETRDKFFSSGINKKSLHEVESAALFVIFEDHAYEIGDDPTRYANDYVLQCLHGKVNNRWFDKSFNISFGTNGRYSMNVEHSWADSPVLCHMFEEVNFYELQSYDEKGNIFGTMEMKPPNPTRLQWDISNELVQKIDEAYTDGINIIKNVDHLLLRHEYFGKGFIKTCKVSPDAFIQMALQLAYYRDMGKFSLTYEASMTRLFREGRTETVRSCTIESTAWVKAMEDPKVSNKERVRLMNEACIRHQQSYLDAMCGRGVDRHLFCLYVVSKYLEVDSPFLKQVVNSQWNLSTSQTPHGQTPLIDLKKYPELTTPGGGFGPVSSEGYGISYIVSGENNIYFHISSNKTCPLTDTERFSKRIVTALYDIKAMFEEFNKKK